MDDNSVPIEQDYGMDRPDGDPRSMEPARPADSDAWCKDFAHCLDAIEAGDNLTSFHHYPRYVNPGLDLNTPGYPILPLPLAGHHGSDAIKAACRRARARRGCETVLDAALRTTWELDHTQFQLTNPDWSSFLDEIVKDAGNDLGLRNVTAKPDKLVLYEPGSFNQPRSMAKEWAMVATLVICLPSEHQGGNILASFEQLKFTLPTAPTSRFGLSVLAWPADASHEVKELTSGYRLVLTYKLFSRFPVSSAPAIERGMRIKGFLSKWSANPRQNQGLVYPLKHKYTEPNISLQNIRGRDQSVCLSLHGLCSKEGFYLMLARTAQRDSLCYANGERLVTILETVYSTTGEHVASDVYVRKENFLGQGLGELSPDDEDETVGIDEDTPAMQQYHGTAVFIVPKGYITSYMASGGSFMSNIEPHNVDTKSVNLISMISNDLEIALEDAVTKHAALEAMSTAIDSDLALDKKAVRLVTGWALNLDDTDLWVECLSASIRTERYLPGVVQALGTYLANRQMGFDWDSRFDLFIDIAQARDVHELIENGRQNLTNIHFESLEAWAEPILFEKITSQHEFEIEDLSFIFAHMWAHYKNSVWTLDRFLPLVASRGSSNLLYELLHKMTMNRTINNLDISKVMYESIAVNAGTKLDLYLDDLSYDVSSRNELCRARKFVRFYAESVIDNEASGIGNKILDRSLERICRSANWPEASRYLGEEFLHPLAGAMRHSRDHSPQLTQTFFKQALQKVIHAPLLSAVRPRQLPGWAHRARGCYWGCQDCGELNAFLASQERTWRLTATESRVAHVQSFLPKKIFSCASFPADSQLTLEVTKLDVGREYAEDCDRFQTSVRQVEFELLKFKMRFLESLLGDDAYRELVLLKTPVGDDIWGDIPGVKRMLEDNDTAWPIKR